jgi:hypothetical protein
MEAIKDTVSQVMQGLMTKKKHSPQDDPQAWLKKALTRLEREHIKFTYFKKGVLYVNVDSSGWLYSLTLKKDGVLNKLAKHKRPVKDIRFRIGEIK